MKKLLLPSSFDYTLNVILMLFIIGGLISYSFFPNLNLVTFESLVLTFLTYIASIVTSKKIKIEDFK